MFREMIRKKQELSKEDTIAVLQRGTNGVLAVAGDNGYPYGVPLSYTYAEGKIYFHCGQRGHKIDALERDSKVCFTVVDKDQIVAEELTSYFRSAIVFGRAVLIEEQAEKEKAHIVFSEKYSGEFPEKIQAAIKKGLEHMRMYRIDIDHMSGKEAIELVREKSRPVPPHGEPL